MRTLILTVLTTLVIISLPIQEVKAQDPIDQYDGIPLVIYSWKWTPWMSDDNFVKMKEMGVFAAISVDAVDPDDTLGAYYNLFRFKDNGLKVIPNQTWKNPKDIHRYTDAHYTVWEAEGTDPAKGKAELVHSMDTYFSSGAVVAEGGYTEPGQIIWGPGYPQNVRYGSWIEETDPTNPERDSVVYFAEYRMKIEQIVPNLPQDFLEDVVCTLMVTATNTTGTTEYPVMTKEVTVAEFNGWNNWRGIQIDNDGYDLTGLSTDYLQQRDGWWQGPPEFNVSYMQFKVIWAGLDYLNLYIDKIGVYDNKGFQLTNPFNSTIRAQIGNIVQYYYSNSPFNTTIIGWYGQDEPQSIDNYEPYRVVDSIINATSNGQLRLHAGFTSGWKGSYGHLGTGAHKLYGFEEFWLRARPKNIQINMYNYHYPYKSCCIGDPLYNPAYADSNIAYVTDIYLNRINNFDTSFAFSTQAGKFGPNVPGESIIPSPNQINYHVNLGLMYGAKELRLDPFFSVPSLERIGLINENEEPTENYYFFKNTLIPRLNGWFGKELRKIHQKQQFTKLLLPIINPTSLSYPWLESIGYVEGDGLQPPDFIDLGFFETHHGSEDIPYFMITSRWYSTALPGDSLTIHINKNNSGYINWNVTNFIDSIMQTVIEEGDIKMPHIVGDARLFKVYPVVLDGGTLLADETAGDGMTLKGDMIIDNGATLTIYDTYTARGNITIKHGNILNGENGKIVFAKGKGIIIDGNGSITGAPNSKLQLEFSEPIEDEPIGMVIKTGGSLTISNCKILDATIGINSLLNANYINAQNVDFINCETHSISIAGRSPGMNPTPPPQIYGCTMLNSNYGIFITNLPVMLIQNNIITNTACGIYLSNVTSAQVINNYVNSTRQELEGMLLLSSGGNVRGNLIIGYTVGLHLANSAPVLGSNRMTSNKYHGLYIGDGSRPYMRQGQWIGRPPNMYATSGYNKIHENGGYEEEGGPEDNDGSEIYFNNSNAEMSKGCNSIYDNREPEPPLVNTYLLMNCPAGGNQIYVDARGNYWGYRVEPGRFGNLRVDYIPYNEQPCPEPQSADGEFVLMTSSGDIIDTVYSIDEEIPEMSEIEEAYAEAEEYFLTGDLTNALQIYESIVNSNSTEEDKYFAYERKYSIGKLTGQSTEYFNQLSNTFSTLASNTQDTLDAKILNQLSTLSKVGEQEYETAIGEFDVIIQQNPNTEEAVYAEIDALTTALLIEEADSTLQKGRLGKYLIKTSGDYNQRVDEILRKNFGGKSKETEEELLPTEYTLYQNYPNPFNPVTTIKYDLPNVSEVSIIIYDILGRKVKELVNTKQPAGRYEVQFNASNLASGVYIYQLIAENPSTSSGQGFISSKKMILLK